MVSSLLSTVCLQSAEGLSLGTAWFLHSCAPSASADSVHFIFRSKLYSMVQVVSVGFKARLDNPNSMFQDIDAQLKCDRYSQGWIELGSLAAQPVLAILVIALLSIRLSKNLLVKSGNV